MRNKPSTGQRNVSDALDRLYANQKEWPGLLPHRVTGAASAARLDGYDASGLPILVIDFRHQGDALPVKCNPATYACLLSISMIGNSCSINRRAQKTGKPHLRFDDKDNLPVARMVAGLQEGENATFVDGDPLNLCHCNVACGAKNPRTTSDEVDAYIALLLGSKGNWGRFEGSDAEQFDVRKKLLHRAIEGMRSEREAALRPRAA